VYITIFIRVSMVSLSSCVDIVVSATAMLFSWPTANRQVSVVLQVGKGKQAPLGAHMS
jgi:hypothetical protein